MIKTVRNILNQTGFDIIRHSRFTDFEILRNKLLRGCTHVVDVGANSGQWGSDLRRCGWSGPIYSFEPINYFFNLLEKAASDDKSWNVYNFGLGDVDEQLEINVAGNHGGSSSFLQIDPRVTRIEPDTKTIQNETCDIRRLSDLKLFPRNSRVYLKADVQGFELKVLDGSSEIEGSLEALELEVSLVALYSGSPLIEDILIKTRRMGFAPVQIKPGFADIEENQLLQMDIMFKRII